MNKMHTLFNRVADSAIIGVQNMVLKAVTLVAIWPLMGNPVAMCAVCAGLMAFEHAMDDDEPSITVAEIHVSEREPKLV